MAKYWDNTTLEELVQLLTEGRLHLFAGAGLSCLAGYPTWTELLKQFADAYKLLPNKDEALERELPYLLESTKSALAIPQHLCNTGEGNYEFSKILRKNFEKTITTKSHELLLKLPFAGYITINYDRCFEEAAKKVVVCKELASTRWFCFPPHKEIPSSNLDEMYNRKRFLLHMHGCLYYEDRIDTHNIILTKAKYHEFYDRNEMKMIYNKMLCNNPVLYFGTRFDDPWFMEELYKVRGHDDRDKVLERESAYVILPISEQCNTERNDELEYGIKYMYFDKENDGLMRLIEELFDTWNMPAVTDVSDPKEEPKGLKVN